MRCSKAREHVSQQLDAILPPDATGRLRDHLDGCADCRSYREDLLAGQRLLAATEPTLPENFDWKLQLRLNQALQEAAGETRYPWHQKQADRWAWWRNFGAATAVGLAAVLALAMVIGPTTPGPRQAGDVRPVAEAGDRRPLFQPAGGGLYQNLARPVAAGSGAVDRSAGLLDRGWSGGSTEDLLTIRRLREENRRLSTMVRQYQRLNASLRAQLDTGGTRALDLQHEDPER